MEALPEDNDSAWKEQVSTTRQHRPLSAEIHYHDLHWEDSLSQISQHGMWPASTVEHLAPRLCVYFRRHRVCRAYHHRFRFVIPAVRRRSFFRSHDGRTYSPWHSTYPTSKSPRKTEFIGRTEKHLIPSIPEKPRSSTPNRFFHLPVIQPRDGASNSLDSIQETPEEEASAIIQTLNSGDEEVFDLESRAVSGSPTASGKANSEKNVENTLPKEFKVPVPESREAEEVSKKLTPKLTIQIPPTPSRIPGSSSAAVTGIPSPIQGSQRRVTDY
ncbi:hypothetical protein FPQ18DRAFT_308669 [Pyronema domesticum]|nr:hypothetical protein FPQ18DRAFT_308669 [Pyronema domesticum]